MSPRVTLFVAPGVIFIIILLAKASLQTEGSSCIDISLLWHWYDGDAGDDDDYFNNDIFNAHISFKTRLISHCRVCGSDETWGGSKHFPGVNICPKNSETVYTNSWVFRNCLSWSTRKSSKLSIKIFLKLSIKISRNISQYFSSNVGRISSNHIALSIQRCVCGLKPKMPKDFSPYFPHLFDPKLSITSKNFWYCL